MRRNEDERQEFLRRNAGERTVEPIASTAAKITTIVCSASNTSN